VFFFFFFFAMNEAEIVIRVCRKGEKKYKECGAQRHVR